MTDHIGYDLNGAHQGRDPVDDSAERDAIEKAEFDRRWADINAGDDIEGAVLVIEQMQVSPRWIDVVRHLMAQKNAVTEFNSTSFAEEFSEVWDEAVEIMMDKGEMPTLDNTPHFLKPQAS